MEKYIYRFQISNNQQEYSKCLEFMDDIASKRMKGTQYYQLNVQYCKVNSPQPVNKNLLQGEGFSEWNGEQIWEENVERIYIFYVTCSDEDDVVNLIYFCMIKDRYPESMLCVDSSNPGMAASVIPHFLFDEISESMKVHNVSTTYIRKAERENLNYNNFEYFINDEHYGMIPMTMPWQKIFIKFSSLIKIDQKANTARVWGTPVGSFLRQFYQKVGWQNESGFTLQYVCTNYWPKIIPKALLRDPKNAEDQNRLAGQYWEYNLFRIFTECLCKLEERKYSPLTKRRYAIIQDGKFFELIKDIPLLALYIFCLFDYFSKDISEMELTDEELFEIFQERIFNARDMAEGLLQIIENVYHSEYHKGYFYFRIHTLNNGSNEYLKRNYLNFIQSETFKVASGKQHILEVKVADCSQQAIADMFLNNYKKRMDVVEGEDREAFNRLYPCAEKVTLRSFFNPSDEERDFWQSYNSIAENIVHHYGLQAFDSFVLNNQGYFYVQSKKGYCLSREEEFYDSLREKQLNSSHTIPGSQYEVLIPFQTELEPKNTSLNVNINYTKKLLLDYNVVRSLPFTSERCTRCFEEQPDSWSYQEKKEGTIHALYQKFHETVETHENEKETVLWCSAREIALTMTEMFCKVIMLHIVKLPSDRQCFLLVTDCTQAHFMEITRMFALFYDKQGMSSIMDRVQIYLAGENNEEFLIAGGNIGTLAVKSEKLVFAKGVTPKCVGILKTMLRNKPVGVQDSDVDIIPFDMIRYSEDRETLFEKNVGSVLDTDIQSTEFGCKLQNLHVRIGNKIHITTFYEAELLFHNNYYTSRFAYWLAQKIYEDDKLDKSKSITLVGYETYSEMLLRELQMMLEAQWKEYAPKIESIIYEQKTMEKFRASGKLYEYADSQFILVVPINSTTTTHSKLAAFLQQSIEKSWKQQYENIGDSKINIAGNYGVVVIGPDHETAKEMQIEYWEEKEKYELYSKVLDDKVTYFIKVVGTWHEPLQCRKCFPLEDYTLEQPLIETNKESIVPMHAIRIKSRYAKEQYSPFDWASVDVSELKKVEKLADYLVYGHIVRKNNHFNYYFDTDKYFHDNSVQIDVIEWLKRCRKDYDEAKRTEGVVYDIIVAPLHFSNAAFVNAVNRYFFNDAALVLHFDIEKEFRNNVKTKYSNLVTLYENLCAYNKKATINFHYADDTIVSGGTYVRAHSLMQSLFPRKKGAENVAVNVFASVMILLNRMSLDSQRNYISDIRFFFSYVNLQISSMRNHEDACVLCKKESDYLLLAEQSSLNEVSWYWKEKSGRYHYSEIEEYHVRHQDIMSQEEQEKELRQKKRAVMRMICSHKANLLLSRIKNDYNEEGIERHIFDELLVRDKEVVDIEEMIAYLKVIARPFICFNKEVKSAIFSIMLKMLNYLLMDANGRKQAGEEYENISKCLNAVINSEEDMLLLIRILINRLVELGSNYIIRKENMEALLDYGVKLSDKQREKFFFIYVNRVKQLIYNGTDETKSLFFEHLLLYDEEYAGKECIPDNFKCSFESGEKDACLRTMFLENSKVIVNGIGYLSLLENYDKDHIEEALNHSYYLENYAQFLQFQKVVEHKEGRFSFIGNECDKIQGMIGLRKQLNKILKPDKKTAVASSDNTYGLLLNNIIAATGAANGEFIVPYKGYNKEENYLPLELKRPSVNRYPKFDDSTLVRLVEKYKEKLNNGTYYIEWDGACEKGGKEGNAYVIIRYVGMKKEVERISEIYLILLFREITNTQLFIALKNVLTFRKDIWTVFNLTSDTLLKNWMNDRYYKMQMRKARSVGHRDLDNLKECLDYVAQNYHNKDCKEVYEKYLSLAVDSLIGYYNTKILSGEFKDSAGNCPGTYTFGEFWSSIEKEVNAAAELWSLTLLDREGQSFYKESVTGNIRRCQIEGRDALPDPGTCEMMILSALQSIRRHSKENDVNVIIYEAEGFLYIKNRLSEDCQGIKENLRRAERREGAGISVAVIIDICKIWYNNEDTIVYVEDESNYFVVRLPMLEIASNK